MASVSIPLPFERSYWVIQGRFLAGFYPGDLDSDIAASKLNALLDCGVRRVINLMEVDEMDGTGEPFQPYETELESLAGERQMLVVCQRFPIKHQDVPSWQQMRFILDTIDQALANGETVYIHSWDGRGRTGSVVGCFLARHKLALGRNVVGKLASLRSLTPDFGKPSPETVEQIHMINEWREGE